MKKSMLQAMPTLTASQEMKEVAMADEPKKETTYYGHTYTTRTYFAFMNCLVQDGVLKAAFFRRIICGWMVIILLMRYLSTRKTASF